MPPLRIAGHLPTMTPSGVAKPDGGWVLDLEITFHSLHSCAYFWSELSARIEEARKAGSRSQYTYRIESSIRLWPRLMSALLPLEV